MSEVGTLGGNCCLCIRMPEQKHKTIKQHLVNDLIIMLQMIEPQAAGKHLQQFISPTNIMAQNLTKQIYSQNP